GDDRDAEARRRRAGRQFEAATIADPALALFLDGHARTPEFAHALARLERDFPDYAPGRFLRAEREAALALEPRPLDSARLTLATDGGERVVVELAAVLVPISPRRAAVMFVDGRSRVVYGQRYVDGGVDVAARLAAEVMTAVRTVYREEADLALKRRDALPPASRTLQKIDAAIDAAIAARAAGS
ncbi:MAG: hypothetical protein HYR51_19600, partial [Candidatus Rokubacteria bacterium]|nr:hypothetical protein [Candidatus Rokubacteria bacterium]